MDKQLAEEILDEVRELHAPGSRRRSSFLKLAGAAALVGPAVTGLVQISTAHLAGAVTNNTYVVNTLSDTTTTTSDVGQCATGGSCSFREAIHQYNMDPTGDADTINFSVHGTFGLGAKLEIDNTNSDPLTINGNGPANTIFDGGGTNGILGMEDGGAVTISGITLQHGSGSEGAAITNEINTTLTDSVVTSNTGADGAIYNIFGGLTLTNSTVNDNTSTGDGGGIFNDLGPVNLTNDTIVGNSATTDGGGIYDDAPLTVTNVTFSGNTATSGGALYNNNGGAQTIANSIFAGLSGGTEKNTPNNCAGDAVTDDGGNVDDDGSCNFTAVSSISDASDSAVGLGALTNNGGPTSTEAITSASNAASLGQTCPTTDQRGVARPSSNCSSGAYQVQAGVASPPNSPTGLMATNEGNEIVVSWNASSGANCYDVYRYTSGTAATLIATVCPSGSSSSARTSNARSAQSASGDPTYTDTSVSCGVAYSYYVTATNNIGPSGPSNTASASVPCSSSPPGSNATQGYWLAGSDGGIFSFGNVSYHGSVPGDGIHVNNVVGMAPTHDSGGYWLAGSDGGVFTFGDATYHGSVPGEGIHINNVRGIAPTADGGGYYMVGTDGGVFTFGDAIYHGSVPGDGIHVNNIIGILPTPDGGGYWIVGSDGGVFTFGDATYHGSVPGDGIHVNDVVGLAPTADGAGYWMVGTDGGVFTFGDATYHGSVPGDGIHVSNVRGIFATGDGAGYWLFGTDGGIFTFGDATYEGSVPGDGIHVSNVLAGAT